MFSVDAQLASPGPPELRRCCRTVRAGSSEVDGGKAFGGRVRRKWNGIQRHGESVEKPSWRGHPGLLRRSRSTTIARHIAALPAAAPPSLSRDGRVEYGAGCDIRICRGPG